MTKTYEQQRGEIEMAQKEMRGARAKASHLENMYSTQASDERDRFDALLKDPDFQRWIREKWEAREVELRAAKAAENIRTVEESPARARIAPTPVPEGSPIQVPNPIAPCMHSVYGKGTCLLPWGHNTDHNFDGERIANVLSTKAMFCDGPAPTPAQVARIRNEALETAARDMEALKLIGAHECVRILRNLKTPEPQ